jgi:ATP-dependent helicase/DNAse subunit B
MLVSANIPDLCDELGRIADSEKQEFVRKKIKKILETIKKSGIALSLAQFGELFWTLATTTKASNIPLYNDRVLIASVDDFVPTSVPYLFIANCADGILPKGLADDGLLLERDTHDTEISPKPGEQRKLNREHIVVIMSCVTQHIVVSSYQVNGAGENINSGIVLPNLRTMGAVPFDCGEIVTKGLATLWLLQRGSDYPTYCAALDMKFGTEPNKQKITCGEELFFSHKTIKPTMVEKFYSCPYWNFIDNGLKIAQRELYELKPIVIGSIIHKIIEVYFSAVIENKKVSAENAILAVFADEKYKRYCDDERNAPLINGLKKEAAFIIAQLEKNLQRGDFVPFAVEYEIKKPLANGYLLHGRIDRVDRFVDGAGRSHYAIIDYKTGTIAGSLPKKIYMGEKLQLPLYAGYFANMGEISGAGYLPLSKGFAGGGAGDGETGNAEKNIQLCGFVDKSQAVLFDREIGAKDYKSKVLNIDPRSKQLVGRQTVAAVCKYADKMVLSAAEKIIGGYIAPNPADKDICEYCLVRAVCPECENVRRSSVRLDFNSFSGEA